MKNFAMMFFVSFLLSACCFKIFPICWFVKKDDPKWSYQCTEEYVVNGGVNMRAIQLDKKEGESITLNFFMSSTLTAPEPVNKHEGALGRMYKQSAYRMNSDSGRSTAENGNILFYLDMFGAALVVSGERIPCEEI
ncbi:MAG: hypothetical protein FWD15_00695 [Alphaproteobacteria bacterium]|nr:hypothetical protein [Alphaproteobacteria bacterium]